jgi:predicted nucleotidyltransferase
MDFRRPVEAIIPGVQGSVVAVLLESSGELNLRTIARLAGVSVAQASRVLPLLVQLGVVERREVPPSSLFRVVPDHVTVRALMIIADARRAAMAEMGEAAAELPIPPEGVIVFGSFARGDDAVGSDIDVVVVRPAGIDQEDETWRDGQVRWEDTVRRITGNSIEIVEVGTTEFRAKLAGRAPLWRDVQRDGRVIYGGSLDRFTEPASG